MIADPVRWLVVLLAPGAPANNRLFGTEAEASAWMFRLKGVDKARYATMIPPRGKPR